MRLKKAIRNDDVDNIKTIMEEGSIDVDAAIVSLVRIVNVQILVTVSYTSTLKNCTFKNGSRDQ